jgi:hypothetical protein
MLSVILSTVAGCGTVAIYLYCPITEVVPGPFSQVPRQLRYCIDLVIGSVAAMLPGLLSGRSLIDVPNLVAFCFGFVGSFLLMTYFEDRYFKSICIYIDTVNLDKMERGLIYWAISFRLELENESIHRQFSN